MSKAQHDVTLEIRENLEGKPFPCPVCKMALPVEISQKGKPYCICNVCGIQIFFRGKAGIRRLQQLLETREPLQEELFTAVPAFSLYNRLEELKRQRKELEEKQGVFFRDGNLDTAIAALNAEIKTTELELAKMRKQAEGKK